MALAALKDRKMLQAGDGTLVPWLSDGGKQMRIAAAQPDIPWTDLAYSLLAQRPHARLRRRLSLSDARPDRRR